MNTPIPFNEEDIKKVWNDEPWDDIVPRGFISDFVLATRGISTPTQICIWTAVSLLSSVLKRETHFGWFPIMLFPNFFIVIVAPPKICGKSTASSIGEKILRTYHKFLEDDIKKVQKQVNILTTKASPESFGIIFQPKKELIKQNKRIVEIERYSQMSIIVSELATFLSRKKYNTGMIQRLTDLYDCREVDDDLTFSRGHNIYKDLYVTMIGSTTPTDVEEVIPEEAFGGGFLSRTIFVHQPKPTRKYSIPHEIIGAPSIEELQKRLAWIAENCYGSYILSDEARKFYDKWYDQFFKMLQKEINTREMLLKSRLDIHLLKLSLIIRVQRYEEGNIIELTDLKQALNILNKTYKTSFDVVAKVGANPYLTDYTRVTDVLKEKTKCTRRALLNATSPYGIKAKDINEVLKHLVQAGLIMIKLDGDQRSLPSKKGDELYFWIGRDSFASNIRDE